MTSCRYDFATVGGSMTTVLDFLVMMNWRRAAAVVLDKREVDNDVAGL